MTPPTSPFAALAFGARFVEWFAEEARRVYAGSPGRGLYPGLAEPGAAGRVGRRFEPAMSSDRAEAPMQRRQPAVRQTIAS